METEVPEIRGEDDGGDEEEEGGYDEVRAPRDGIDLTNPRKLASC